MEAPPLVLASTSRYRRELLARLGLPFSVRAPACDEDAIKRGLDLAPLDLAVHLARAKAESLRGELPSGVIIGSDQIAEIDGVILGKPGTADRAAEQLALLAGRTHRLITAVALAHPGGVIEHVDVARLTMRPLAAAPIARYVVAVAHPGGAIVSEHVDVARLTMRPLVFAQIARYVAADAPLDCAGSYKLEARGIALFSRIESEDSSAITGLPLIALTTMLSTLGFAVP